jgi:hypothetical protein
MKLEDEAEFTERYLARLDGIGIEFFQQRFSEISEQKQGRGLALLCFEPVGQFCHRHLFARWVEQQTGRPVPELEAKPGRAQHVGRVASHEQIRLFDERT